MRTLEYSPTRRPALEPNLPTSLALETHKSAIASSGHRLAELAAAAGESTKVPTCPAWDVRALLAHQTMVHRWATAHVSGTDPSTLPSQTEIGESVADLNDYYVDGMRLLLEALDRAPANLEAMTFLRDAPAPREFWARRQAHETTVHMVDALAASLQRMPTAEEAAIERDLALDGIDELLAGFFTRGRSKVFDGDVFTMLVAPDDSDRRWHVRVAESLTITDEPSESPRLSIGGTAASIYLGLWNRSDELTLTGDHELMKRWRKTQKVRWR
ncbi:MAG: maleylpyruvate isomerase family mycothiol-dependent enzyme [Acidimicrobiia bacterium]|nr:maleylpyruvate isomerase family mycothiol-dependent enzyme [Acidimicrobiia bacterium]